MYIKNMYKIHGLATAQGHTRSQNTPKFYDTYDDADRAANQCLLSNPSAEGIVIYKAIKVLKRETPPIVTLDVHGVYIEEDES